MKNELIVKNAQKAIDAMLKKYSCEDETILDQGSMSAEDSYIYEQLRLIVDLAKSA